MKSIAYILVAFIMLFNSMGHFVVFKSAQFKVRKEIKKKLKNSVPEGDLHIIAVAVNDEAHKKEFTWIHSMEFRYRGCMYDIVKTETRNDTIMYHCINDVEEQVLFERLDELVSRHHENSPATQKNTQKLFKNIIREALPEAPVMYEPEITATVLFSDKNVYYDTPVADILLHPPEPEIPYTSHLHAS